jgi:hypothetical protein
LRVRQYRAPGDLLLIGIIAPYLLLFELAKSRFYARAAAPARRGAAR